MRSPAGIAAYFHGILLLLLLRLTVRAALLIELRV